MAKRAGLELEREMWRSGRRFLVGCDEVGRGAVAGSLVIAAVAIPEPVGPEGFDPDAPYAHPAVADSKLLAAAQRAALAVEVAQWARAVGVGEVSAAEIDRIGMAAALRLAARRALAEITRRGVAFDAVLVDGPTVWVPDDALPAGCVARSQVRGDCSSVAMAAASVVAKVFRDEAMVAAAAEFDRWGFDINKGYGTAAHEEAIRAHGLSPLHRVSWSFVDRLLGADAAAAARGAAGGSQLRLVLD